MNSRPELKNRYALNSKNELTIAKDATKVEVYHCIECSEKLILKDGSIREKHFSHKADSSCESEELIHKE